LAHPDAPGGITFVRQCSGCGLRRLNPRPGREIIHLYYGSDYGAYVGRKRSALKQALWDFLRDGASGAPGPGRRLGPLTPFLKQLANLAFDINIPLAGTPLPRILEVGCGFGDLLLYWQSRGADTLGVDFDERAVSAAKNLGIKMLLGDLTDQSIPNAAFDIIVFNHSLEHLYSPKTALREAARLLRKNGKIFIAVPNGNGFGINVEKSEWVAISLPLHFWFFDYQILTRMLLSAGFSQVQFTVRNHWQLILNRLRSLPLRQSIQAIRNLMKPMNGDTIRATAIRM